MTISSCSLASVEIIFSLHLERIAITNTQPRCRFIIECVEREVPDAALTPQPAAKRSRKSMPKKKPTTSSIVTDLTSSIEPASPNAPVLPDLGELETFLASIDYQNGEPSRSTAIV